MLIGYGLYQFSGIYFLAGFFLLVRAYWVLDNNNSQLETEVEGYTSYHIKMFFGKWGWMW